MATDLETALNAAITGGYIASLSEKTHTIATPIIVNVTSSTRGPVGIDLGGARLISQIRDGSPVIQIVAGPGVDLSHLVLSNFSIEGNGLEGDGIRLVADGSGRKIEAWSIDDVVVSGVGGAGLDVVGAVRQGTVSNSWFDGNAGGGARVSNGAGGSSVEALRWLGGGFRGNGAAGLELDGGARDVTIEGASFIANHGPGLSATSGITSVHASSFVDNQGAGVLLAGDGTFVSNSFSTVGPQVAGIGGIMASSVTLLANSSAYLGPGTDPTALANLQGTGVLTVVGPGDIVAGAGVTVTADLRDISAATVSLVAMPVLQRVTAATTAAVPDSAGSSALEAAFDAAMAGHYIAHLTEKEYTVTTPIVINVTSTTQGPVGIDLGGARIVSRITNGAPVIQINVGPGVDLRYLSLSNFSIEGNGQEGGGIKIVADGNDRWLYTWNIDDVRVSNVGGIGLDVLGSVFEGTVSDSWMDNNAGGGARFAHSVHGGVVSSVKWLGGGFSHNGVAGLILDNGARDMSVEGAAFTANRGPGIVATNGVTSVHASHFEGNQGAGIVFVNYGNFGSNTFESGGAQGVGVSGYMVNPVSLIGNVVSDGTVLATLRGTGPLTVIGEGAVVTGPGITTAVPHVTVATTGGIAMPALRPIDAATTAPKADSTGSGALEAALDAALAGGYVAHLTDRVYTVTAPIVVNVTATTRGPVGIDLGGARILSQITSGEPVLQINVAAGVDLAYLTLSNFSIEGNGREGDGIKIVADGADRQLRSWTIENVNVEHVGGIGLDVIGNVFDGTIFNAWMSDAGGGGARFANGFHGGVASRLNWLEGGFRKNDVAGLILANGARDLSVEGAYFVDNRGPGIAASSGISLVHASGFENNRGAGVVFQNDGTFVANTFWTYGPQTIGISGTVATTVTMSGNMSEYYGGSSPTVFANLQGQGELVLVGQGGVVAGPGIRLWSPEESGSPAPTTVSVAAVSAEQSEGNNGTKSFGFKVSLSQAAMVSATVRWSVTGFGANPANATDFGGALPTGIVTFMPGETVRNLAVTVAGDGAVEADEGFSVVLSAASDGLVIGAGAASARIVNDDSSVSIAAVSAEHAEGSGGTTAFTFLVTRAGQTSASHRVDWVVSGSGTHPVDGSDFAAGELPAGALSFEPGEISKSISVAVVGDTVREAAETFIVSLTSPSSGLVIGTGSATATIDNDDGATVSVAALSAAKPEGTGTATDFIFTVTLSAVSAAVVTVSYAVSGAGANAADGTDFAGGALPAGTVTFAPGETSKTITLSVAGDGAMEADEAFAVTLSAPSSDFVLGTAAASGTIANDDARVSLAALAATRTEGNGGSTSLTFTATLSGTTSVGRSVAYAVSGSGTNPASAIDFSGGVLPSGSLSFAAGETSKTISVPVAGDSTVEPDESFTVTLSNPSAGLTIDAASATGTIANDDATVSIAPQLSVQAEGDAGTRGYAFTVTLSGDSSVSRSLAYAVGGSGANPASATDFSGGVLPSGSLSFAAGETSKTISVPVAGDGTVESDESFTVTLSNPSAGLTIGAASATGTIANDDATVSIGAPLPVQAEGNSGTRAYTFSVTLSGDSSVSRSLAYAVTGSGANPASATDFSGGVMPSGSLSFAAGETSKTINVLVAGDSTVEPDEGFTVTLSDPSTGLAVASARGTITNDDASVSLAALSAARPEGDSGATSFTFTATLTGDTSTGRSVAYAVVGAAGNPAAGADFQGGALPTGVVTFAPGETSETIVLRVAGDTVVEADEGFIVTLSSPTSGLVIGTASAAGTILNDDEAAAVTAHDDAYVVLQGQSLAIGPSSGLLANDLNAATVALASGASHGALQLSASGALTYAPAAGFAGVDSFTYQASGSDGAAEAEVVIYVVPTSSGSSTTLDLVTLEAEQQVAATYLAFFGRGADWTGFDFWVNEFEVGQQTQSPAALFANIASSFAISTEAQSLFPFLAGPFGAIDAEIEDFLAAVYQNLFDRSLDEGGRHYWTAQTRQKLADGTFVGSVLVDIMSGAQEHGGSPDITTLMAKVAVSLSYVEAQRLHGTVWTEAGSVAEARTLLNAVTADPLTILTGIKLSDALALAGSPA